MLLSKLTKFLSRSTPPRALTNLTQFSDDKEKYERYNLIEKVHNLNYKIILNISNQLNNLNLNIEQIVKRNSQMRDIINNNMEYKEYTG